jgi:hypothetical protein
MLFRAHKETDLKPGKRFFENPYFFAPRAPRTMPQKLHNEIDEWFYKRFQIRYRSASIFCTGNVDQAKKYLDKSTTLLELCPIDEYSLAYCPIVVDLFDFICDEYFVHNIVVDVEKLMNELPYVQSKNSGLKEAAQSKCEVMIVAKKFKYRRIQL